MTLTRVAEGVWTEDRVLDFPGGMKLPIRMTALRDAEGALTLVSPVRFDDTLAGEVSALGPVRAIVGPNLYHHLFLRSALERFPEAELFLAPGLAAKRPTLPKSHTLDGAGAALGPDLTPLVIEGAEKMNEVVFVHGPSRTLVVTDLFFNVVSPANFMSGLLLSVTGTRGKLAQSRTWRFLVKDKRAHRACLGAILERPLDRIVMAHGEVFSATDLKTAAEAALLPW